MTLKYPMDITFIFLNTHSCSWRQNICKTLYTNVFYTRQFRDTKGQSYHKEFCLRYDRKKNTFLYSFQKTFPNIFKHYCNLRESHSFVDHRAELFSAASQYVALHYITRIKSTLISTTIMYNVRFLFNLMYISKSSCTKYIRT